jgi:hypothetical protein
MTSSHRIGGVYWIVVVCAVCGLPPSSAWAQSPGQDLKPLTCTFTFTHPATQAPVLTCSDYWKQRDLNTVGVPPSSPPSQFRIRASDGEMVPVGTAGRYVTDLCFQTVVKLRPNPSDMQFDKVGYRNCEAAGDAVTERWQHVKSHLESAAAIKTAVDQYLTDPKNQVLHNAVDVYLKSLGLDKGYRFLQATEPCPAGYQDAGFVEVTHQAGAQHPTPLPSLKMKLCRR